MRLTELINTTHGKKQKVIKSKLLLNFLRITSLFSLLYIAVSFLIDYWPGVVAMIGNFFIFVVTLFIYLNDKIKYETAAHLYIFNACFVAVFTCTYYSGGIMSPVAPWFLLISVIALLLFGRNWNTYFWLITSLILVLIFGILSMVEFEFPTAYNLKFLQFFTFTCVIGLVLIVFLVTKIFEQEKDEAMLLIKEKNNEILDSIYYAQRIQEAILPPITFVKSSLGDSFVLYEPKDIVAGDFYWVESRKLEEKEKFNEEGALVCALDSLILFAAADCTGHGVPGAMVSVVCSNALKRATREYNLTKPSEILDKTREIVLEQFSKSEKDVQDGMDIALCSLNTKTKELEFAGAHNSLWILKNNSTKIESIKGDRQPIGKFHHSKPFTNHKIQLEEGDQIYISTDGYADQFGGEYGKKLKAKEFQDIIIRLKNQDMTTQGDYLKKHFEDWKGDIEQIDDICVIGVRI